jgi:hypothetical protein
MAFVFVSLGCVLLSKTLDKVYLDAGFNVNMALGTFFLAGAFVVGGLSCALDVFGLMP